VALTVARVGAFRRGISAAGAGALIAALGIVGAALGSGHGLVLASAVVQGAGTGMFAAHVAPLVVAATAPTHQARVQSLLVLVQNLPLLVATNAVAALAAWAGAAAAVLACAAGTAVAGLVLLRSPGSRRARRLRRGLRGVC
jgi:hypothetical protein